MTRKLAVEISMKLSAWTI